MEIVAILLIVPFLLQSPPVPVATAKVEPSRLPASAIKPVVQVIRGSDIVFQSEDESLRVSLRQPASLGNVKAAQTIDPILVVEAP